jgi:hypothetical protein
MVSGSRISPMSRRSGSSRRAFSQAAGEVEHVGAHLPLADETGGAHRTDDVLNWVLEGHQHLGAGTQRMLHQSGESRALATARGSAGDNQPVGQIGQRLNLRRQIQLCQGRHLHSQQAHGGAQPFLGGVDVDAQAADSGHLDGAVDRAAGPHLLQTFGSTEQSGDVGVAGAVERLQRTVHTDDGRPARAHVNVAGAASDGLCQDGTPARRQLAGYLDRARRGAGRRRHVAVGGRDVCGGAVAVAAKARLDLWRILPNEEDGEGPEIGAPVPKR